MTIDSVGQAIVDRGWAAIDLPDPGPVFAIRDQLLAQLRADVCPDLTSLDDYHSFATEDDAHVAILHRLSQWYWERQLGATLIEANLDLIRGLVGSDLHIQRYPYLRAVRPGRARDAAPLHRDTYYGASPYELSVLVPFTEMDSDSAIRVVTRSHIEPDGAFPFDQVRSEDVVIGSKKHELGFPYAPKRLHAAAVDRSEPVPLRVGQALLFGLSLVHGGGVNSSRSTRFSTDIRVANSLAPVQWSRGVRADYFVPLCSSPIGRIARAYLAANQRSGEPPR